jgi:hypothetical protein
MISEQEVIELYRCLLGRSPEDASTIKAFRGYYPSLERGRKAVFDSDEFLEFYGRVTGRAPHGTRNEAAELALALLARAGASLPVPASAIAEDPARRAGMRLIFQHMEAARLVIVVGQPEACALEDLVPLGRADAAVLHIAPGFPPAVPLTGGLPDGTTVFRLGSDISSLAAFLHGHGRRIDALYLLGRPADPSWVHALRGQFAARALLVVGPQHAQFPAAQISAAIDAVHPGEPVQAFCGLKLHHFGGWHMPVSYAPPAALPAVPDCARHPRLAVAAIVRNEAVCIENMLRSVAPIARFVAILDTGSTDGTPALAENFLAGAGLAFAVDQKPASRFGDDFSAMRNAAVAMVPAGIDWVLMLDADEELVPEDFAGLFRLMESGTHDAYALPRYNFPGADKTGQVLSYPDRQVRLLRHTPEHRVRYSGAVHETVRDIPSGHPPLDASALGGARGGPHIHHLVRRFRTPEQEERKQEFYREIARKSKEKGK